MPVNVASPATAARLAVAVLLSVSLVTLINALPAPLTSLRVTAVV